jgi:7-carboxy-7-deazaguanine synthase
MLKVSEVFFSIQGEGTRAGLPCVFVRLTGCPLRCQYCDTRYAFEGGEERSQDDLLRAIAAYPCRLVELTGGEPLAQPEAFAFLTRLADEGWDVLVETSGHVRLDALDPRVVAIMDVKTPGSGEHHRMEWDNLGLLREKDEVKLVLTDRADYEWAREWLRGAGAGLKCAILFAPVHGRLEAGELARWVLDDGLPVRVQLQLHRYLWPTRVRGV